MSETIIRHREWESDDSSEEGTFTKSKRDTVKGGPTILMPGILSASFLISVCNVVFKTVTLMKRYFSNISWNPAYLAFLFLIVPISLVSLFWFGCLPGKSRLQDCVCSSLLGAPDP
ncbi:hypothetical protein [Bifidobacterium asteroides]|uniref:Uncharacterized protein n=1 Tax=Bifidobacterium asteroides TaxID=1684 RepID=A0A6N7TV54_9BIFI|nr:hypothetical protein [Bifidobacterium asteroides]MSD91386.1 hypothetical protein [Bifidobacterium asteroides]